MANKLLLLSNAQKTTLEAFPTYTETALPQVISALTPGTFNVYRISDVVTGVVTAAPTIPFVQAVGALATSAGGTATAVPPAHATDDLLIFVGCWGANQDAPDLTGQGYTNLFATNGNSSTYRKVGVWWQRATSGAMANVTFNPAGANDRMCVLINVRGASTVSGPQSLGSGKNDTNSTTVTIPHSSVSQIDNLILDFFTLNQAANLGSLQSGSLVNADLASIAAVFAGTGATRDGGIYVNSGERAASGALADSTITLSTSRAMARGSIAIFP